MNNEDQKMPDENNLEENKKKEHSKKEVESETQCNIDPKEARIAELEAELTRAHQNESEILLRAKAENENIRRRSDMDVEKAHKFALERFTFDLLPVIDNLERALEMSDKFNGSSGSTIEGIELTLKSLLDAVHKAGLDVICETRIPFNPDLHQAMTVLESDEYEPNCVMAIIQKGYILNGRLIRPAMVAVSKSKNINNLNGSGG